MGTDRDSIPTCKEIIRTVAMLSWLCIVCIKCMEQMYFDSPAEADIIRKSPTSAKVFLPTSYT